MYQNMSMPPPWAWGGYAPQPAQPNVPDLNTIREWSRMLKDWEKDLKGNEKKPEVKGPSPGVISMMLLMLLLSPITGPSMYYFFQLSIGILHK